tara:strand:- start:1542 stop:2564 length:1023 start_codon:yes stop_codon:yes gene_type:complete
MIAIHNTNVGFHKRWREYCILKNIKYKDVDCYANNIIEQLKDCDALMWHYWQTSSKDFLKAKRILFALEHAGIIVFPNFKTAWHFDDKIAQKYLLEVLNLPLVKSYHFIDKREALNWTNITTFPKVFKLKGGAGSSNVQLVESKSRAVKLIKKAFGSGFKIYDSIAALKERYRKFKEGKDSIIGVMKSFYRIFRNPVYSNVMGTIKNEIYFQDFVPNNDYDIRVIVIGDKAFAIKRLVRDNDFRASGSGNTLYAKENFDINLIKSSFEYAAKLKTQSCTFDYVILDGKSKILEISYGYAIDVYEDCVGYWDKNLVFYEGKFDSTNWMIDYIVSQINKKNE